MSELKALSPLNGATVAGFATVREIGPLGMISLRAKPEVKGLAAAVKAVTGCALPETRRIVEKDGKAAGWMSPDEYLLILPRADVTAALVTLATKLKGQHHLAVDVSDARAVFRIEGALATQALMKLMPVDFASLAPGELRRSRAAQVAAAIWASEGGYTLVSFRSVAGYVLGILSHSVQKGAEPL